MDQLGYEVGVPCPPVSVESIKGAMEGKWLRLDGGTEYLSPYYTLPQKFQWRRSHHVHWWWANFILLQGVTPGIPYELPRQHSDNAFHQEINLGMPRWTKSRVVWIFIMKLLVKLFKQNWFRQYSLLLIKRWVRNTGTDG